MTSWIFEKEYEDYLKEHPEERPEHLQKKVKENIFIDDTKSNLKEWAKNKEIIKNPFKEEKESTLGYRPRITTKEERKNLDSKIRDMERMLIDKKMELLKSYYTEDWFPNSLKEKLNVLNISVSEILLEKKPKRQKIDDILKEIEETNNLFEKVKVDLISNPFLNDTDDELEFIDCYYETIKDITHMIEIKKETS